MSSLRKLHYFKTLFPILKKIHFWASSEKNGISSKKFPYWGRGGVCPRGNFSHIIPFFILKTSLILIRSLMVVFEVSASVLKLLSSKLQKNFEECPGSLSADFTNLGQGWEHGAGKLYKPVWPLLALNSCQLHLHNCFIRPACLLWPWPSRWPESPLLSWQTRHTLLWQW